MLYVKSRMRRGAGDTGVALMTLLAPVSWGTTYVTITEWLPADRPLFVALVRVVPAGVVLAAVGLVRCRWHPAGRQWRQLGVLALLNFGLFFPLLIAAIYRLPGGVAASAGGLQPLLVGTLTWLVTGRAMRPFDIAVGVFAAVGVGLVVVRPGADVDVIGVVAAIGANLSFAGGVVATKVFAPPPHRLAATGWQLVIAALLIAPVAWLVEGPAPPLTTTNLAGVVYLSLFATGAAFVVWFRGISRLPVPAPPVLGLAAPITGAALGWILLGEDLTALQILGFVMTIGAICYAATRGAQHHQATGRTRSSPTSRPCHVGPG